MATILVADDSASVRKMVEMTLVSRNYRVVAAADGQAALATLEGGGIDLVVLDVNMPVMDGLTFLKIARARPGGDRLPVLMLTTVGQEADRERALALGATGYMTKPFSPAQLLERVASLLAAASGGPPA